MTKGLAKDREPNIRRGQSDNFINIQSRVNFIKYRVWLLLSMKIPIIFELALDFFFQVDLF